MNHAHCYSTVIFNWGSASPGVLQVLFHKVGVGGLGSGGVVFGLKLP